jgi:hypothetical protein
MLLKALPRYDEKEIVSIRTGGQMMKRLKKSVAFLITLILLLSTFPVYAADTSGLEITDSSASFVRLKNKWKSNYLYEGTDGTVRYGFTAIDDKTAQWKIVDEGGNKRFQNRDTGHFITIANTTKRGEALTAVAVTTSTADDQWIIEDSNRPGFKVLKNVKDPTANLVIHEEDQLGFAEVSGDINVTFESPQWALEPVHEGTPVRIVNQYKAGQYLYEDADGFVQFGDVGVTNAVSHWYLDPGSAAGVVRIVNRATGHYITQSIDWDRIKALPLDNTAKSEWVMTASNDPVWVNFKNHDALTADPANPQTWVLNTQFPDDKYARSNSWAQPEWGSALWKIEKAYDVLPIRVVNFTNDAVSSAYLYEAGGIIKYGAIGLNNGSDPAFLWVVEDFNGKKRLRNQSTGHYMSMQNAVNETDPLQALDITTSSASDQWTIANSAVYDDYKTIQSNVNASMYVNVKDATGSAQASTVNPDTNPAQWLFEDPSVTVDGKPQVVRIQNEWQSLFLYEDNDGNLKYGNAKSDDQKAQWVIDKFNGRKRIMNKATGHFINLENMIDGHIRVTSVSDDWTSAIWVIEDLGGGVKLIHSVQDKNDNPAQQKFIHLQNLNKYAEYGVINRNWGSPHWKFIPVTEEKPSNVRLKNKLTGQYLYESNTGADAGKVKYGDVPSSDSSSVWFMEDTGDGVGSVRLKNIGTGHYYVMENIGGDVTQDSPPQQLIAIGDICTCWGSAKWYFDKGSSDGFFVIRSGWAGHFIYTDGNGYTKVSKLVAAEDSAQFAVEPYQVPAAALPVQPIRIKNSYNNQYLYENAGGIVLYGTPAVDNGYSHWLIESLNGVQWLKNRATGHYIAINGNYRFVEAKSKTDTSGLEYQWVIENSPDGVKYLIRSNDGPYSDEYLNVQNGAGYPERGLYPFTLSSLQWTFETAPEQFTTPSDAVLKTTNTSTPIFDDTNSVHISVGDAGYLYESSGAVLIGNNNENNQSAQWLLQDYNGRRLIKNRATGHQLALTNAGAVVASSETGDNSQWLIEDRLGKKVLKNAGRPEGWLNKGANGVQYGTPASPVDVAWTFSPIASNVGYEAEEAFMGGGVRTDTSSTGFTGQGYATGFAQRGAKVTFAVNAQQEATFKTVIRYRTSEKTKMKLNLYVNGIDQKSLKFDSSNKWDTVSVDIPLRAGINSITLQNDDGDTSDIAIDSVTVNKSVGKAYRGATVPYVSYEAEHAATNADLIGPSRAYRDMASEASGRQAVKLNSTDDYVEFKLAKPANSIVLRYAIPDSPDGQGLNATLALYVNGKFKQNLSLTSKYAWEYGSYPWSNDPKQGSAHRFFDEIHALIGDVPAGTTIRLQKNADNNADYYVVDLADMEQVAEPLTTPKGFLSVTTYGAVPNDGKDDTAAFKETMDKAKKQNKGVWFPQGQI